MKKVFKFKVTEVVEKVVEVEADNLDEAEALASQEDLGKNPDAYNLTTTLLEKTYDSYKYPTYVNGWNLVYPENLTYWKKGNNSYKAVSLYWLDTVEGDEGYNPEHDSWVILEAYGDTVDEALESLDIMPFPISDVMPRKDAEYTMLEWFKSQEV